MKVVTKFLGRWALAASLMGCAVAASAETLRYDGPWFGSYGGVFNIQDSLPGPSVNLNVYTGPFRMTSLSGGPTGPAGSSFMAWCVDVYHFLNTSPAGTGYMPVTGANFYTGADAYKTTDLGRLATYVFGNSLLTNPTQAAAFQLATWEIVNEQNGHGTYNVTSGDFRASGNAATLALANNWLGVVNAGTLTVNQGVGVFSQSIAGSTQNLVAFTSNASPTPEPEAYILMLAGMGMVGFMTRRRRLKLAA